MTEKPPRCVVGPQLRYAGPLFTAPALNVQRDARLLGGTVDLGGTLKVNRNVLYTPTSGTSLNFLTFVDYTAGDFSTFTYLPDNSWNAGGQTGLGFTPVFAVTNYSLFVETPPG